MAFVRTENFRCAATPMISMFFQTRTRAGGTPRQAEFSSSSSVRQNRALLKCAMPTLLLLLVPAVCWASFSLTFQGLVRTLNMGGSITLSSPAGVVVDSAGNVFMTDTGNSRIVAVSAQGTASVVTITGLSPALSSPTGIALDGAGNLYVADTGNSRVVKITPAGPGSVVTTGSVTLSAPRGIALDQSGDIFIADTGNSRIAEVTSGGSAAVLTITVSSGTSTLSTPKGLGVDKLGTLFVADSGNNRVVKVAAGSTTGVVVSILGGVTLSAPSSVCVDRIGNVIITDTGNSRIAEVDTASNGTVLFTDSQTLNGPLGVALDVFGTVYIADTSNSRALIVDPPVNGDLTPSDPTYSLNKSAVGFGHLQLGSLSGATLILPFTTGSVGLGGVKIFTAGTQNLDFTPGSGTTCNGSTSASTSCSVEIKFLPTAPGLRSGAVVLYDGSQNPILTIPLYGFSDSPVAALSPNVGTVINTGGLATSNPFQTVLDGAGNIYVGDYTGKNVTKIPAGGGSASLVSLGTPGGTAVQNITGVALDGAGNLFIGDHQNSRILVKTPGGVVSVLSITGLSPALGFPTALAFDAAGNLYIADFTNGRIVEISTLVVAGSTSSGKATVVNTGSFTFTGSTVTGMTIDLQGSIYIAARTQNQSEIIKVTTAGVASALALNGLPSGDPGISNPQGVVVDPMGTVYVVDTGHSRVLEVTTAGVVSILSVGGLPAPSNLGSLLFGLTVDSSGNLYVSDWTNNRLVFVNVSGAALSFASTNQGSTSLDSPKRATVTNLGNLALTFSVNPAYTSSFSNNTGETNPCTASTSLSAGMLCDVSVNFTPQSVGSLSAAITVTDNTLNVASSTQQVAVSGTGLTSGDTTALVVAVSPTTASLGQPVTVTAKVTDSTSGHTATVPSGSVNFSDTVGSTTVMLNGGGPVTMIAGHATLTGATLSGLGSHTITANYGGVTGSFLSSANTTTLTVSKDTGVITGPTPAASVAPGQAGTVAITVAKPYSAAAVPSGSMTYTILNASNVSVASGTLTLTAGTGSATATVPVASSLASGTYSIRVTYSGDGNYAASSTPTAIPVTITDFSLVVATSSPTSATVSPGGMATYALNIGPTGGTTFPGVVTLTLTGLPPGATGTLTPSTLPAGAGLTNVVLTVQLPTHAAFIPRADLLASSLRLSFGLPSAFMLSSMLLGMVFLPFGGGVRRAVGRHGRALGLLLLGVAGISLLGLAGCASHNSGYFGSAQTSYTLTITGTSGTLSHSTTVNLIVQ
jgi:sugar lactone lactonase YvrE